MRIITICTKLETRDKRLQKLKEKLIDREYRTGRIDEAIKKSRIRETLNLLTDADSSTDTKTDRNGQFFF